MSAAISCPGRICPACMASIGAIAISAQAAMTTSRIAAIPFFPIQCLAWQNAGRRPVIPITPPCEPFRRPRLRLYLYDCGEIEGAASFRAIREQRTANDALQRRSNQALQGRPQILKPEPVPARLELAGLDPLAGQKQLLRRHLAKGQRQRKSRYRKKCGARQNRSQHL